MSWFIYNCSKKDKASGYRELLDAVSLLAYAIMSWLNYNFSKKDKASRYRELLDAVSEPMLQYLVDHASELVVNNNTLLLTLAIITHANGKLFTLFTPFKTIAVSSLIFLQVHIANNIYADQTAP